MLVLIIRNLSYLRYSLVLNAKFYNCYCLCSYTLGTCLCTVKSRRYFVSQVLCGGGKLFTHSAHAQFQIPKTRSKVPSISRDLLSVIACVDIWHLTCISTTMKLLIAFLCITVSTSQTPPERPVISETFSSMVPKSVNANKYISLITNLIAFS